MCSLSPWPALVNQVTCRLMTAAGGVQIIPVGTTGTYSVEIIQGRTAGCTVNYLGANTCAAGGGVLLQVFTQGTTGYQQWTFTEVRTHCCMT